MQPMQTTLPLGQQPVLSAGAPAVHEHRSTATYRQRSGCPAGPSCHAPALAQLPPRAAACCAAAAALPMGRCREGHQRVLLAALARCPQQWYHQRSQGARAPRWPGRPAVRTRSVACGPAHCKMTVVPRLHVVTLVMRRAISKHTANSGSSTYQMQHSRCMYAMQLGGCMHQHGHSCYA